MNIDQLSVMYCFPGKTVVRLEYEAYIPMASSELRKICKQTREKWDIHKIVIYHRIGLVYTLYVM
jgi:molybdopterin synthase catalytic subunit